MKYIPLNKTYFQTFENVHLTNVYKCEEGKQHYYGIVKVCEYDLKKLKEFVTKSCPKKYILDNHFTNNQIQIKFTTHYGKPQYKARKANNMPTVAEALVDYLSSSEQLEIDLIVKIQGFVLSDVTAHVVIQCVELYIK